MRRLLRLLAALFLARRTTGRPRPPEPDPRGRELPTTAGRAELAAALLLLAAASAAAAFVALFFTYPDTQLLGATLGLALALTAAAFIAGARRVAPQETAVEERPQLVHEAAEAESERELRAGAEGVFRRRLIGVAAGCAGCALAAAVVVPITTLGPAVGDSIVDTPWLRGRRVVDVKGRPITMDDVPEKTLVSAFPERADTKELGAAIVLVRLAPGELEPLAGREDWDAKGIVAYSKICTHAACAVSLYRVPTYEPTSEREALVCPCHYSTFDPARGAEVIFGPAGRPLPQLPLTAGPRGELRAGGGFSGPIGPAWLNVRRAS